MSPTLEACLLLIMVATVGAGLAGPAGLQRRLRAGWSRVRPDQAKAFPVLPPTRFDPYREVDLFAKPSAADEDPGLTRVSPSVVQTQPVTGTPGRHVPLQNRHRLVPLDGASDLEDVPEGVLGRDVAADLPLVHARTSRRHAYLRWTDDGWQLQDLGSLNGTWVNGMRLTPGPDAARLLRPLDVVTFGEGGPSFTVMLRETGYAQATERAW